MSVTTNKNWVFIPITGILLIQVFDKEDKYFYLQIFFIILLIFIVLLLILKRFKK